MLKLNPLNSGHIHTAETQRGAVLLESLIAILIFSLGILALAGLQSAMMKNTSDAKFRADASFIAQETLGILWADPENIADYVNNEDKLPTTLPNTLLPNGKRTVSVDTCTTVNLGIENCQVVTVTVTWQQPGQSDIHKFQAVARISGAA